MLDSLNPTVIGYTLNVVGLFFLASAISFKKPKREIEEILGVERLRSLSTVRDKLVNQVQVYIGFVFLVAGYILLMAEAMENARDSEEMSPVIIAVVLLVATIATMAALKLVELLFTRRRFRRLLAEIVRDSNYSLERNQKLAVQIGELLDIPQTRDESVPEYIAKVRRVLGLADMGEGGGPPRRPSNRTAESPRA